ncbi:MAG: hypothetical protein ACRCR9_00120 [Chitinophagaceae bacterium]
MPCDYKRDYPKNWFTEIRPAVLKRANHCCEFCGIKNYTRYWNDRTKKWVTVVLTIAHLDHDKENDKVSLDRLAALWQSCHLQYDINHHIANRKYGRNHKGKHQLKLF